jgi:hypothetical protein
MKGKMMNRAGFSGISLALASSAKRITRKTAERVIDEFMRRVERVNRDRRYYYRITAVVVYSSYLTECCSSW